VHRAGDRAGDAREEARAATAAAGHVELQDVPLDQVARADEPARADRRCRVDLVTGIEMVLAERRVEVAAIDDVQLSTVDERVGHQIRQRDAGLEIPVIGRRQPFGAEIEDRDGRLGGAGRERQAERRHQPGGHGEGEKGWSSHDWVLPRSK